jgi:hypothetical protein
MRLSGFILVALVFGGAAPAQAQKPDDGKKPSDFMAQSEVLFTNDSAVRMSILQERVEVETKFGKLSIPIAEIAKIDFGVHVPPGLQKQINQAIDDLDSDNYKTRELALNNLVGWGPYAYPAVYKAVKSGPLEVKKRAQLAMDKLKAKHPARKLRLRAEDIIYTESFTVVGKITTLTFKAKADNFGEVELQLAKLRLIRSLNTALDAEVTIDAAKYAVNGQWMDSGFEAREGMRLHIVASGNVDLWPQQGGRFSCGPGGFDQNAGFGKKIKGGGLHLPGALLGRIGTDGPTFVIGDSYNGATNRDGKLYLQIVPSPWNQGGSVGTYNVKITPSRDFGGY